MPKVATILQQPQVSGRSQRRVANFFLVTPSGLTLWFTGAPILVCLLAGAGRSLTESHAKYRSARRKSLPTVVDAVGAPTQILLARVDRFLLLLGQFKGVLQSLFKVPGTFYNPSYLQKYTDGQQTPTVSHHPSTSLVLAPSLQAVPLREPSPRYPSFPRIPDSQEMDLFRNTHSRARALSDGETYPVVTYLFATLWRLRMVGGANVCAG